MWYCNIYYSIVFLFILTLLYNSYGNRSTFCVSPFVIKRNVYLMTMFILLVLFVLIFTFCLLFSYTSALLLRCFTQLNNKYPIYTGRNLHTRIFRRQMRPYGFGGILIKLAISVVSVNKDQASKRMYTIDILNKREYLSMHYYGKLYYVN